MDFPTACSLLGIDAGKEYDLTKAYKDALQVWHPDRFCHNERLAKQAEEQTKKINEAYEYLKGHWGEREGFTPRDTSGASGGPSANRAVVEKYRKSLNEVKVVKRSPLRLASLSQAITVLFFGVVLASVTVVFVKAGGKDYLERSSSNPDAFAPVDTRLPNPKYEESVFKNARTISPSEKKTITSPNGKPLPSHMLTEPLIIQAAARCDLKAIARELKAGASHDTSDSVGNKVNDWLRFKGCEAEATPG